MMINSSLRTWSRRFIAVWFWPLVVFLLLACAGCSNSIPYVMREEMAVEGEKLKQLLSEETLIRVARIEATVDKISRILVLLDEIDCCTGYEIKEDHYPRFWKAQELAREVLRTKMSGGSGG